MAPIGYSRFQAAYSRSVSSQTLQSCPVAALSSLAMGGQIVWFPIVRATAGPYASYTPSACSSKPDLPQIRFSKVWWRRMRQTSHPLLDWQLCWMNTC